MLNKENEAIFRERDERIRAVLLTLSGGPKRGESYKDWLADQREARKRKGIWKESDASKEFPIGFPNEDFITGMRASRRMKEYFGIRRKYEFKK